MLLRLRHLGDINANLTVGHSERLEGLSTLRHLVEENIIFQIIESNLTGSLVQNGTHGSCGDDELVALLLHLVVCLAVLRHDNQALLVAEALLGSGLHTDYLIVYNL